MVNNQDELLLAKIAELEKLHTEHTREIAIEAALDEIRSRSMSMNKSEEHWDVVAIVFKKFQEMNFSIDGAAIIITKIEGSRDVNAWLGDAHGQPYPNSIRLPYYDSPSITDIMFAIESGMDYFSKTYGFEEKNHWFKYAFENTDLKILTDDLKNWIIEQPYLTQVYAIGKYSSIGLHFHHQRILSDTEVEILKRFSRVFDQAYIRFLDLKKAEAQAREAEIQLALERVRARTMAMQQSSELAETALLLFQQLQDLGFSFWRTGFYIWKMDEGMVQGWTSNGELTGILQPILFPWKEDEGHNAIYESSLIEEPVWEQFLDGEPLKRHYEWMLSSSYNATSFSQLKAAGISLPEKQYKYASIFKQGYLMVIATEPQPQMNDLLKRFARVFEQCYTRFIDLQKAEAQAREAQIEAALERVRSRTMAMHQSEELLEVITVVSEQLQHLNFRFANVSFAINNQEFDHIFWLATPGQSTPFKIHVPYIDNPALNRVKHAQNKKIDFFADVLTPEENHEWLVHIINNSIIKDASAETKKYLLSREGFARSMALTNHISFTIGNYASVPYTDEENAIFKRFANVFEQSFTRFLDLQKAEAQAKEAQIEAALERVRSKTMAMHNSQDVGDTVISMFDELVKLEVKTNRCGILIYSKSMIAEVWTAKSDLNGKALITIGKLDLTMHPLLQGLYHTWENKESVYTYPMIGDDLISYYQAINNTKYYPTLFDLTALPSKEFHADFYFAEGSIFSFTNDILTEEATIIFKRFAGVFGQTYRRYLDLQKAEAQTREAQIETALERVRSRTLAMQKSEELAETAVVVFKQLINLGIEPNRLYIGIIKEDNNLIEFWITDEDGSKVITQFTADANKNGSMKKMYEAWKEKEKSLTIEMQGKELAEYFQYLSSDLHVPFKQGLSQKKRIQNIAFFGKGFIGMASPEVQPEESIHLLERFAAVFNLTYTRFNDLQIAEHHAEQAELDLIKLQTEKKRAEDALKELRSTQSQLIQSEKMASLGELTAGIAHEIQNPLNFVNNFSEVSTELIDEMNEEIQKGHLKEAELISNDLKENLSKINHHGKRAGEIVRSMLQHSRSSSGQKEPTDINALADEYLRLAYHGLRAKDKSFNATMHTDFNQSIGMVNIIPQDIGRVILNLITNAFYVVNEKKKNEVANYEPTVTINTTKSAKNILISVCDNGNGIPKNILDKIFQPFFTTKPTGQGTGLGLSLSYDIVKAHGGELRVETKEGEGSVFIIQLPID